MKKFEVLPVEFSIDGGELTPTMKIKRNVVNEKYADAINRMYSGADGDEAAQAPSRSPAKKGISTSAAAG